MSVPSRKTRTMAAVCLAVRVSVIDGVWEVSIATHHLRGSSPFRPHTPQQPVRAVPDRILRRECRRSLP